MLLDAKPPPPSRTALIVGLGLGALVGLGSGAAAFDLAGVVQRRTTPQDCADQGALEARITALEGQLTAAGRGDEVEASAKAATEGAPVPWAEEVPESHRAAAIPEAAKVVAKEYGATVGAVDCEEYPCIVTFVARKEMQDTELGRWGRRIDGALLGELDRVARTSAPKGAPPVHTVAVPHRDLSALERVRTHWRVTEQDRQAVGDRYVVTEGF